MAISTANVQIVRAGTPELGLVREALSEIVLRTSSYHGVLQDENISSFLASPSNYFLLALHGTRPVGALYGYLLYHPHRPDPQLFLYGIDVDENFRNRGIGTSLVRQFVQEARKAGASEVWVITNESNQAAMKMYLRAGLERASKDDVVLVIPTETEG